MLQVIRSNVFSSQFSTSFQKSLHSSSILLANNVRRGRGSRGNERKSQEDMKWELEQSMNPFVRNTGAARQLRLSGLDPDDPGLAENLGQNYFEDDLTIEGVIMESKGYKKKYKIDEEERRIKTKNKLIKKSVFPKPHNPNLLTWIEKETIKYLHKLDPVEWSVDRLADSFPATPGVIQKVLRNKGYTPKHKMIRNDLEVKENWKLLTEGKLEIDPKLQEHLASSNRKELGLSSGQVNQMEQEILEAHEKNLMLLPPRPVVPGPFGSIIVNYKKKLESANNPPPQHYEAPDVIEMERLFGDNSVPGTPMRNEVSSWGETALLATDIDLAKERKMDIEQFRKKYQKPRTEEVEEGDDNPYRKKYLKWLDKEREKSFEQTRVVPRLSEGDVSEVRDTNWIEKRVKDEENPLVSGVLNRGVSEHSQEEEVFVFDENSGYKKPFVTQDYPDTIEIPQELKRRHKMYRVNDCYYDQGGEFVYRVPGMK